MASGDVLEGNKEADIPALLTSSSIISPSRRTRTALMLAPNASSLICCKAYQFAGNATRSRDCRSSRRSRR